MIKITHTFACDYGSEEVSVGVGTYLYAETGPRIVLPKDWTWVNGKLMCPSHKVIVESIEPDGKVKRQQV